MTGSRLAAAALDGRTLVLVVIVGGLLTLQSSAGLTAWKVAYLVLAVAALAGAIVGAWWWLSSDRIRIAFPWFVSSAAFAILLAISLVVSRAHGTSFSDWLRDVVSYGLFAAAPIFGLACARSASRQWIIAALALFASLASVSFAVEWLGRRNILTLPIDRIVLPSGGLSAAFIALATAFALVAAGRRWVWAVAAGAVLGLFFMTGTRSSLILIAIPAAAGLLAGRPWRRAALTVLIEVVVAVAIFVAADLSISIANGTLPGDIWSPGSPAAACSSQPVDSSGSNCATNGLAGRLGDTGTLFTDPTADASFQERWAQTQVAWQAFMTSPVVGVGPGYRFHWQRTTDIQIDAFTLDTPLVYLAKFGLVGLIPLLLFAAAYLRLIATLWRRTSEARIELLAICGYGIMLLCASFLNSPMEDKGVGFALVLFVAFGSGALLWHGKEASAAVPDAPMTVRARLEHVLPFGFLGHPNGPAS